MLIMMGTPLFEQRCLGRRWWGFHHVAELFVGFGFAESPQIEFDLVGRLASAVAFRSH